MDAIEVSGSIGEALLPRYEAVDGVQSVLYQLLPLVLPISFVTLQQTAVAGGSTGPQALMSPSQSI